MNKKLMALLRKRVKKELAAKKKVARKQISEKPPKETKSIDEILDELDLTKFVYGDKTDEQLLKETQKSLEKNPEIKELLNQAKGKGANKFEIVKIIVKNHHKIIAFSEQYLKLKKACEEDIEKRKKYKKEIRMIQAVGTSDYPFPIKTRMALFNSLPGLNEELFEIYKESLKVRMIDITKLSLNKTKIRPGFTKIMVDLYEYLRSFFEYSYNIDKQRDSEGFEKEKVVAYITKLFDFIARLMELCFPEHCKGLTSGQVKSRIQKRLDAR